MRNVELNIIFNCISEFLQRRISPMAVACWKGRTKVQIREHISVHALVFLSQYDDKYSGHLPNILYSKRIKQKTLLGY